jgi:hypothetical protein
VIKPKNFQIKAFSIWHFKSKGSILNRFNSILSPLEYNEITTTKNTVKIQAILNYLAPNQYLGKIKRVGGKADGSYVVPIEMLDRNTYLLSGGIEDNNKFEIFAASRGITGIQIDNLITKPPQNHPNLEFLKATLGDVDKPGYVSLEALMNKAPKNKKILIKIDIEGSEIEALGSLSIKNLKRIDCLVMELHNLGSITSKNDKIYNLLNQLHKANLRSIFIQANNACLTYTLAGNLVPDNIEITYVKKHKTSKPDVNYISSIKRIAVKNKPNISFINIDHILFKKLLVTKNSTL